MRSASKQRVSKGVGVRTALSIVLSYGLEISFRFFPIFVRSVREPLLNACKITFSGLFPVLITRMLCYFLDQGNHAMRFQLRIFSSDEPKPSWLEP